MDQLVIANKHKYKRKRTLLTISIVWWHFLQISFFPFLLKNYLTEMGSYEFDSHCPDFELEGHCLMDTELLSYRDKIKINQV